PPTPSQKSEQPNFIWDVFALMPGTERVETNVLDHIIHLSPPGELQTGIERFERLGF
ncbi:hypothetical protein FRB90_007857, partial [Tulasnella sp. 427]